MAVGVVHISLTELDKPNDQVQLPCWIHEPRTRLSLRAAGEARDR